MALAGERPAAKLSDPRFPLSAKYDPGWILANSVGAHSLWLTELLCRRLDLQPGCAFSTLAAAAPRGRYSWPGSSVCGSGPWSRTLTRQTTGIHADQGRDITFLQLAARRV